MDYGALPPEINSGRMYAGPGSGSMLAAAAGWAGLAAELRSGAASYSLAISELSSGPWVGPSSTAMVTAAAPYVAWMGATSEQAELAAMQAQAAVAAYEAAFGMTVPPPEIVANRAQLMMLVATNFLGQNTPAIAATEAQYAEMWAQDAAAMYAYAGSSAAATTQVTPFTAAPETTNAGGLATQAAASTQAAVGGTVQEMLSQLISQITTALQGLAAPLQSFGSSSGLSGILSELLSGSSTATTIASPFGGLSSTSGFSTGGIASSVIAEYAALPGWAALSLGSSTEGTVFGPLFSVAMNQAAQASQAAAAAGAGAAGAAGAAAAPLGSGFAGAAGGLAGLGQAGSIGALTVPQTWGWAATAPAEMLGSVPMGMLAPAVAPLEAGAGLGFPFMFPGLGREAAAAGAGAVAGAAAVKYGPRLKVLARSPVAGYSDSDEPAVAPAPPAPKYPMPARFPTNGSAPPGYQPAIVYVPINGHAPADA
jgi:PPE-repeat protein